MGGPAGRGRTQDVAEAPTGRNPGGRAVPSQRPGFRRLDPPQPPPPPEKGQPAAVFQLAQMFPSFWAGLPQGSVISTFLPVKPSLPFGGGGTDRTEGRGFEPNGQGGGGWNPRLTPPNQQIMNEFVFMVGSAFILWEKCRNEDTQFVLSKNDKLQRKQETSEFANDDTLPTNDTLSYLAVLL